jgi:GDP-L-fucose synthase
MKVLVTGATGFLGTALSRALESRGDAVVRTNSKNCDLRRPESLEAFNSAAFDVIYHLAAWTQAGDFCLHHPGEQWIINEQMNANMLAWWSQSQPQAKLVCMGSSCSYDPKLPLREENYLIGTPIESLYTYGMTKRMLLVGLRSLQKQFGLKYLCLVPSTLYGPGYHTDGRQMHFIFDLIRKILRGKRFGEPVVLWGDGNQSRELVFIEDFVSIAMTLANTIENDIINVGAGEQHTIREFASMICERVAYDFGRIQFDTTRYVGARSKCLDVTKLASKVQHLSMTPLGVGLDRTIGWCEQLLPELAAR